jgi:hypothetical protein
MKGNFQVRFLGEDVAATPCPYPTDTGEQYLQKHGDMFFKGSADTEGDRGLGLKAAH